MTAFEELLDDIADDFLRDPAAVDGPTDPVERVERRYPVIGIGGGMAREVFRPVAVKTPWDAPVVVKFPLTPDHVSANRLEVECWDSVDDTDATEHFAPVIAHADDHRWVVMRRADETGRLGDGDRLEERLQVEGIPSGDLADENAGRIGDRLVAIDYQWGELGCKSTE